MKKLLLIALFFLFFIPFNIYALDVNEMINDSNLTGVDLNNYNIVEELNNKEYTIKVTDKSNNFKYSWTFDSSIKDLLKLNIGIRFDNNYDDLIKNIVKRDFKYFSFNNTNKLPYVAKITIDVSDKFKSSDTLDLYKYNKTDNTVVLLKENLKVSDNKVSFDTIQTYDFILVKNTNIKNTTSSILNIIIVSLCIFTIALLAYTIFKEK